MSPLFREARLRFEFAHLYPFLIPGEWRLAQVLTDQVLAWAERHPEFAAQLGDRALRPEHFEFRGGDFAPRPPEPRRRPGDR